MRLLTGKSPGQEPSRVTQVLYSLSISADKFSHSGFYCIRKDRQPRVSTAVNSPRDMQYTIAWKYQTESKNEVQKDKHSWIFWSQESKKCEHGEQVSQSGHNQFLHALLKLTIALCNEWILPISFQLLEAESSPQRKQTCQNLRTQMEPGSWPFFARNSLYVSPAWFLGSQRYKVAAPSLSLKPSRQLTWTVSFRWYSDFSGWSMVPGLSLIIDRMTSFWQFVLDKHPLHVPKHKENVYFNKRRTRCSRKNGMFKKRPIHVNSISKQQ